MLVPVYHRRLHLLVEGAGSKRSDVAGEHDVSVILDGPDGAGTTGWESVVHELKDVARVIRYDRAGYGWSDVAPAAPTADDSAQDLRIALTNAGIPGPYLLIGHDYGSSVLRRFAHRYARDVLGMVLVEPRLEQLLELAPRSWRRSVRGRRRTLARDALMARLGLTGTADDPALHARSLIARQGEATRLAESDRETAQAKVPDGLPLIVIAHEPADLFGGLPALDAELAQAVRQRLLAELVASSTAGRLWRANAAGGDVSNRRPELIAEAASEIIAGP